MQTQAQPEVVVQKLEGVIKYTQREYVVDKEMSTPEKKRYKMQESEKTRDAGYLLMFPRKGHAIRVDAEELERLRSRMIDPNGMVESETAGNVDMTNVLRSANGSGLVTVIQNGGTK